MFTPLHSLFPKALNRVGLGRQAQAALICEKYRKIAPSVIHEDALAHTFPKFYRKKILTIGVENSAWAYTIITNKKALIADINKALGEELLIGIRTQIARPPEQTVLFTRAA